MPIYEYVCMQCESHFEELVRNGHQPDCPECGANIRKLSVFSAHGSSTQPSFDTGRLPAAEVAAAARAAAASAGVRRRP